MKKLITIYLVATVILMISGAANANWTPDEPNKMHYPQLPDPYGWDVSFTNTVLADDWQCSETGYVKDIHLWFSIKGWNNEYLPEMTGPSIYVSIYADIPAELSTTGYSMPGGKALWQRIFAEDEYEAEYAGSGNQGWLDPVTGGAVPSDHTAYFIMNIENFPSTEEEPLFLQEQGTIYWLAIQVTPADVHLPPEEEYEIGWKTSISEHFMDDAVWCPYDGLYDWQELRYPEDDLRYGQSIDLAFVITPEPTTIALLGLGALSLIRRKK